MIRQALTSAGILAWLCGQALAQFPAPPRATPPNPTSQKLPSLPPEAEFRFGSSRFHHGQQISAAAFSPNGKTILTGGQDGIIRVWDVASGDEVRNWRMTNNYNQVTGIRFSPDGKMFAVSSAEGVVRVYSADGAEVYHRPSPNYDPAVFCWMPDGKQLALANRTGVVRFLDIPSGRETRNWNSGANNPNILVVAPNGKQLVISSYNTRLKAFDLSASKPGVEFESSSPNEGRYYRPGQSISYTPDSKFLIGPSADRGLTMWHTDTGKIARKIEAANTSYIYAMAISPNGRFLATFASDARLRILGLASNSELRVFDNPVRGGVSHVMTYSPDGKYLATVFNNQALRIYDVAAGKELHDDSGHRGPVSAIAFLGRDRLVTGGQDQSLRCWDLKSGKETDRLSNQPVYYNQICPDATGQSVSYYSGSNVIYSWSPGKQEGLGQVAVPGAMGGMTVLSSDCKAIAQYVGQNLNVVSLPDGKTLKQIGTQNVYPQAMAVSVGGRYVAYVDTNNYGTVYIWDMATGQRRPPIVGDPSMSLYAERMVFSPDGRLLVSVASHRPLLVWEVATNLLRATLEAPRPDGTNVNVGLTCAAFSPNGRLLAVGGYNGDVRVTDLRSGVTLGPFTAHRGQIMGLAFSPDGTRLGSSSVDTTAVVWDVAKITAKLPARSRSVEPTPRELDGWWTSLASSDGRAASEAIWSLADYPKATLPLFRDKLKPVPGPDPRQLAQWVKDLDNAKYFVRESANQRLAMLGESAREALEAGLNAAQTAESRYRLRRLLEVINSHIAPEKLQSLRAMEVLEKIGGAEARQQLEQLAQKSTDPEIRKELARVLDRWVK